MADVLVTVDDWPLWPQPKFWDGFNDCEISCDEVNGHGLNPEMMPPHWDSLSLSRPTVMAGPNNTTTDLPQDGNMEVDMYIRREQSTIMVRHDPSRVKVRVE